MNKTTEQVLFTAKAVREHDALKAVAEADSILENAANQIFLALHSLLGTPNPAIEVKPAYLETLKIWNDNLRKAIVLSKNEQANLAAIRKGD